MSAAATAPAPVLCLASVSPRRSALLTQIGLLHRIVRAEVDESPRANEPAAAYVERLARAKAQAVWDRPAARGDLPVLGADTTVVVEGRLLGKPATREEGVAMLLDLAGRTHHVFTAVALATEAGVRAVVVDSAVTFRRIERAEAELYWASGEPADKAGGYAIQGLGAVFVAALAGSYSGVMGLPLHETALLLAEAGIPYGQTPAQ